MTSIDRNGITIFVENRQSSLYRALSTLEKKEGGGPLQRCDKLQYY